MTAKGKAPSGETGGMNNCQFDNKNNTLQGDETQPTVDFDLAELRDLIRLGCDAACVDVGKWEARVDKWRAKHGDKPIPVKAFEQHPAADMLLQFLAGEECDWIDHVAVGKTVCEALASSTQDLRKGIAFMERTTAAMFESAAHANDPVSLMAGAVMGSRIANMIKMLIELRTSTDFYGLKPDKVAGCIRVRTTDVQEGGDNG